MIEDRYAGSECIREHPAYREGYDRGYQKGYLEAMQRVVDEILPSLTHAMTTPGPIILPIQDIGKDVLDKLTVTSAPNRKATHEE